MLGLGDAGGEPMAAARQKGQSNNEGANMSRRSVLTQIAAFPLVVAASSSSMAAEPKAPLKIMMKSAWGSDGPTKAAFPFLHARGVTDTDLAQWGAKFGNPTIFVGLVEWADRVITE
jgi:hypothetical protein